METAKSLFTSIDYLGSGVNLRVQGKGALKTKIGALLSLISTGLILGATVLLSMDYFSTDQPKVNIEESRAIKHPPVDIIKSRILPVVTAYLDDVEILSFEESRKYFTITFTLGEFPIDEFGNGRPTFTYYSFAQCKTLYEAGRLREEQLSEDPIERQNIINFGICPDIFGKNISIKGKGGDRDPSIIRFFINPCTLTDGSCKPKSEIPRVGFYLNEFTPAMNLSNHDNPIKYYFNSFRYTYLNPDLGQRRLRTTKRTTIYDYRGFLSQPALRWQVDSMDSDGFDVMYRDSTQVSCLPSQINTPACKPYWMVDTMSGGSNISITRSYTSILDTLSNIGGIFEFIYVFFELVYMFYYRHALKRFLVQKVFFFDDKSLDSAYSVFSSCKRKNKSLPHQNEQENKRKMFSKMAESAEKIIWDSLEVSNLVKELNAVKVLTQLLLQSASEEQIARLALYSGVRDLDSALERAALASSRSELSRKHCLFEKPNPLPVSPNFPVEVADQPNLKSAFNRKDHHTDGRLQMYTEKPIQSDLEVQNSFSRSNLRDQLMDLFNDHFNRTIQLNPFALQDSSQHQFEKSPNSPPNGLYTPSANPLASPGSRSKNQVRVVNIRKFRTNGGKGVNE